MPQSRGPEGCSPSLQLFASIASLSKLPQISPSHLTLLTSLS